MLQRVGEHADEASVICRFAAAVCILLLVRDEEGDNLGSSPPLNLNPVRVIGLDQVSMPETHLAICELAIGKLEHHAAYIGIGEEVVSRELELVEGTACVVEEGVTTPASEEAVLARLRHRSFEALRYESALDDHFLAIAFDALHAAHGRSLRSVF